MRKYLNKEMLIILAMGISSGLPLALTGGTLQAWMKAEGVDLTTIGLFAVVGLPYTLKFLWAPLMDRFTIGKLGRRKGWILLSQALLLLSILGLGWSDPKEHLLTMALLALLVSFFSASQDIVVDAWRREALPERALGLGSSVHVTGYLFSFRMISGALALIMSDHMSWREVYTFMTFFVALGIVATLLAKEPIVEAPPPRTFKDAVVLPFLDYFAKPGAIAILIFILLYKVGDNMASQMSMPFYLDLGFSRSEVGAISKVVGWVSLALGSLTGGFLILKLRIVPSLILFGVFQALSTFGFALLSQIGRDFSALSFVIGFENFTAGMGTTAFVAFMATLTNKRFTATQYALLTSFMGVPRTILSAPTGYLAERMGWFSFFLFCTVVAIPGLFLIFWMKKYQSVNQSD